MNIDKIFEIVKEQMVSVFELDAELVQPEKLLDEDLDLDSLDMVDLVMNLNDHTEEKIDPALFKNARTVQDVAELLKPFWKT